jgi:citrate synthase
MADLQAGLATLGPKWNLRQIVDLEPDQTRDDLARLSAAALSIVAQSARGRAPAVPEADVERGENAAAQFLIRWRGEADPKHVTAVDTYWVSAAEHGLNASTFTARIAASTGADCAAAMSAAVGALSGPLHGGAPTRVLKMLDEVDARGDADAYVHELLARGERIMGFGHRVYRAEDPRARVLRRTAKELGSPRVEVAEALERAAIEALREAHPDRPLETNVEFWAAVVLDVARIPPPMYPAMFGCARVAGWSAHILEQQRTGRLIRPSARYVGPPAHSLAGA